MADHWPYPSGMPEVFSICAASWSAYDMFLSIPELALSLEEFWEDWLSKQPPGYIFSPYCMDCELVLFLVEMEPLRWCYNRPAPNKESWSETAHLVRLLVRWQVVYRHLLRSCLLDNPTGSSPVGPLDSQIRVAFVRETISIVAVWAKVRLSSPEAIRHLREARFPRFIIE